MPARRCPSCREEVPAGARFCGGCGAPLSSFSMVPTIASPGHAPGERRPSGPTPSSTSPPGGRQEGGLAPGSILGGRFRIVSPLGRGGMGVVYRADDLKLGQPVALKLLPPGFADDAAALATLIDEVRMARQISHPNVCRVFDIGEADGRTFFSMEWVDGEDLASLVRRIGRLPADKALEIAHQLCTGLAAAHERGVVHRDLKPSNVLLDGDGQARIADFGLAIRTAGDERAAETAGTPAYMAPEQLRGEPATVRSDLWGLGLVLYELFTGHRAFRAGSIQELRAAQADGPSPLTAHVPDVDPEVDEIILRCLRPEPSERPGSALEVAAALPGGDPLRAAVAAGRMLRPEVVAASGAKGTLSPAVAWTLLAGTVAALALGAWAAQRSAPLALAPPEKGPEVLGERCREITRELGLPEGPADRASYFEWAQGDPRSLVFVYRQSPRLLIPRGATGSPWAADPPHDVPGMVGLTLDTTGRLRGLLAVPSAADAGGVPAATATAPPPWSTLHAEAGLDPARLRDAAPRRLPPVPFDLRAAWRGRPADGTPTEVEVTAASLGGRPVFFEVIPAGSEAPIPWLTRPPPKRPAFVPTLFTVLDVLLWVVAALLARRNVRLGRGDRRGAFRIAAFYFASSVVSTLLGLHWVPDAQQAFFRLFRPVIASSLVTSSLVLLIYLAVEPFARRAWPTLFVAWSRVLAGRFRDPLVGRDVLGGVLVAALVVGTYHFLALLPGGVPGSGGARSLVEPDHLLGLAPFLAGVLAALAFNLLTPLVILVLPVAVKALVRRTDVALAVSVLLVVPGGVQLRGFTPPVSLVLAVTFYALTFRYGVLLMAILSASAALLASLPMALDAPGWVVQPTVLGLLMLLATAIWGFKVSLGGQPALGRAALET